MRLEARVNAVYDQLTANERELVSHILQEKQQVRGMNSTQLAQHLHVSRTTLVRFWKKLGVQSYAEFRLLLQQDQRELDAPGVELGAIVRMYHAMIDELPKLPYGRVCRLLRAAPTIYIYGTGNEQKAIAEEFKRIFLLLGKCCVDLFDLGEVESARRRFGPEDVFVAISLSGEGAEALRVMRCVQGRCSGRGGPPTRWWRPFTCCWISCSSAASSRARGKNPCLAHAVPRRWRPCSTAPTPA